MWQARSTRDAVGHKDDTGRERGCCAPAAYRYYVRGVGGVVTERVTLVAVVASSPIVVR